MSNLSFIELDENLERSFTTFNSVRSQLLKQSHSRSYNTRELSYYGIYFVKFITLRAFYTDQRALKMFLAPIGDLTGSNRNKDSFFFILRLWQRLSALSIVTIGKKTSLGWLDVEQGLLILNGCDVLLILSGIKKGKNGFSVTADQSPCGAGGFDDRRRIHLRCAWI